MALILVTAPVVEPVTLQEAKDHLRVDHVVDDALISDIITAARLLLDGKDGWLGRALITQTWDWVCDAFPRARERASGFVGPSFEADAFRVPLPPLQSVTSITYLDLNGDSQTLDSSLYTVDTNSQPGRIVPVFGETWPSTRGQINAVTVRFVAGYGDGISEIPRPIQQALMLLIGNMYEHREEFIVGTSAQVLPQTVTMLTASYRIWDFS